MLAFVEHLTGTLIQLFLPCARSGASRPQQGSVSAAHSSSGAPGGAGFAPPSSFEDAGDDGIVPSTPTLVCPPRPDTEAVPLHHHHHHHPSSAQHLQLSAAQQPPSTSTSASSAAVVGHLDDTRVDLFVDESGNAGQENAGPAGQGEDQPMTSAVGSSSPSSSSFQASQPTTSQHQQSSNVSTARRPISWNSPPQTHGQQQQQQPPPPLLPGGPQQQQPPRFAGVPVQQQIQQHLQQSMYRGGPSRRRSGSPYSGTLASQRPRGRGGSMGRGSRGGMGAGQGYMGGPGGGQW